MGQVKFCLGVSAPLWESTVEAIHWGLRFTEIGQFQNVHTLKLVIEFSN